MLFVLSAAAIASAAPVLVTFENAGDESLFTGGASVWQRVTGHGSWMLKTQTGNGSQRMLYAPAGTAPVFGAGTFSTDVDLTSNTGLALGGLLLQQKSTDEEYDAVLYAINGQIRLDVGCFTSHLGIAAGHSTDNDIQIGSYTGSQDLGWWHLSTVVSDDGAGHYKAVVTATDPSLVTHTATYIDTGANSSLAPYPAGYVQFAQYNAPINYDNFQIVPEPATLCLLALGGSLIARRRKV